MRTVTSLGVFVLGVLCCSHCPVQGAECSFSNNGGRVKTFFNQFNDIATFPCSYKLADMRCGSLQAVVTFVNGVNDDGDLYITDVTVDVTGYDADGQKEYRRINAISERRWNHEQSAEVWKWENKGRKSYDDQMVKGGYNKDRKSYYIQHGDLKVEFFQAKDQLSVSCKDGALTSAVAFPQTLCGSPTNTAQDVTSLQQYVPGNSTVDRGMAALDYMQLVLQDVKQTEYWCVEARKLVKGRCTDKGNQLYHCNRLYNPNDKYGRCLKDNFNAFRVYHTCVASFCARKGCVDGKDCGELNKVHLACSGKDGENYAQLAGCYNAPWASSKCN